MKKEFQLVVEAVSGRVYPLASPTEKVWIPEEVAEVMSIVSPPVDEVAKVWLATVELLRDVRPVPLLPASVPQVKVPVVLL